MTTYRWLVEEHENGLDEPDRIQVHEIVTADSAAEAFDKVSKLVTWAFRFESSELSEIIRHYLWGTGEGDVSYEVRCLGEVTSVPSMRQRIYQPHHATDEAAGVLKEATKNATEASELISIASQWLALSRQIDTLPDPDRSDEPDRAGFLDNLLTIIDGEEGVVERMVAIRSYVKLEQHRQHCTAEGL